MTHIERATVELHYVRHLLEYAKEDGLTKKEIDTLKRNEEYMEAVVEALSRADDADHFRRATEMVPLTLEQLRGMDGEPVWLNVAGGVWGIACVPDGCVVVRPSQEIDLAVLDGLAYRYPPVETDTDVGGKLDEWTAEWIKHDGYTECSKCEHWYDSPENEDDGDRPAFCPSCGRAMTPGAWPCWKSGLWGDRHERNALSSLPPLRWNHGWMVSIPSKDDSETNWGKHIYGQEKAQRAKERWPCRNFFCICWS